MTRISPTFPVVRLPHLDAVPLPPVMRVRLHHPEGPPPVGDLGAAVRQALAGRRRLDALPPGASVAVAVGSRGIARIDEVAAHAVAALRERGFAPFVVPAMGSHGGGTAEGQAAVLAKLGVTEARVGAPIRATMETVDYGATPDGIRCKFDRHAAGADAVVPIARVKSHTSFDRPVESGLTKMVAVGLGKQEGARNVHLLGPRGYTEVLPALARIALDHAPIACGIALVESARKQLVVVEGVEPEDFAAADERLLRVAKSLLARLPFEQIDALIVEQLGKEISGAGMDYAVMGRTDIRGIPNPPRPFVHKIAVLGLSEATGGNGVGLGVADFTTLAVANALDLTAIYMNSVTATMVEKARIPVVLPDDATAVRATVATCWRADPENARLCVIRSTLHLGEILVSPGLFGDLAGDARAEVLSDPAPLAFDGDGRLVTRC
jgi:hypothetical protein